MICACECLQYGHGLLPCDSHRRCQLSKFKSLLSLTFFPPSAEVSAWVRVRRLRSPPAAVWSIFPWLSRPSSPRPPPISGGDQEGRPIRGPAPACCGPRHYRSGDSWPLPLQERSDIRYEKILFHCAPPAPRQLVNASLNSSIGSE